MANEEAYRYHHDGVGAEHLLLGLLREEEGLASQVLLKSGVTLEKARAPVKQLLASERTTSAPEPHGE
ncbi:MAG: hypothetical protein NVS3B14_05330 [Ktedonobacteraceae bacterium]